VDWIEWVRAPGVRLAIHLLEEYEELMKTINKTLIAALAGIALFSFASQAQAQFKPVGDDGIAASPKVRSMMMKPISSPADVAGLKDGDMVAMACPKCKTVMVTHVNTEKGHIKTATTVPADMCPGCEQKFTVVSEGKEKHNIVMHVCKKCGSTDAFCCVMKKDGEPTKGMEQK
jgi:uncharacterized OB-fold protein